MTERQEKRKGKKGKATHRWKRMKQGQEKREGKKGKATHRWKS